LATIAGLATNGFAANGGITLSVLDTYATGIFDDSAAEIPAFDPGTKRLFVVNGAAKAVDVLDMSDPSNLVLLGQIDVSAIGDSPNSVAVKGGLVAVAIEADPVTDPGSVAFYEAGVDLSGTPSPLKVVAVGALPDMLIFTPDGGKVLVANEGEPDDGIDPEGSVSIIDLSGGVASASVTTLGFTHFNDDRDALVAKGVRIFPTAASLAQDVEPEYIAVSPNSRRAWVALQEANSAAVIDLELPAIKKIVPLGTKDHRLGFNALDASDEDGKAKIRPWPVRGLYMPDAIVAYRVGKETYVVSANEGDARDEDARVADLTLDPEAFPNAANLQDDTRLGRLEVSTIDGDTDGDGDYDQLFAYGARSFSIWHVHDGLVFDSGDDFEKITRQQLPDQFNADNDDNDSFDTRSDAKGPEPEGVALGVVDGRTYAFIGLERIGGVMVYDVTDPSKPSFVTYVNNRNFAGDPEAGTAGDLGPEGLAFIAAEDSPTGGPLLVVANEVSGTTTVYAVGTSTR
jgi:DNA-binding beta-propeller fold protein YncE